MASTAAADLIRIFDDQAKSNLLPGLGSTIECTFWLAAEPDLGAFSAAFLSFGLLFATTAPA